MIPLAVHSHYSLMRGVPGVRDLCARATTLGYKALALTGTSRAALAWAHCAWQAGQRSMVDRIDLFGPDMYDIPNLPPDPPLQRLRREFAMLGFLPACHPMTLIRERLQDVNTIKAANLLNMVGREVRFAGWLITGKLVRTRQGDPMKFLTFEDDTGLVETVFFPQDIHPVFPCP